MFKISSINKRKFDKDGVILLKNFISKNKAQEIQKKIDTYIKKNKKKLKGKDINFINGKVNSLHKIEDKYFKSLCKSRKILKSSSILLNSKPKFKNCEYFAKPEKIGLASPMHQDNYYWNVKNSNAITMWIALTPANKNNGSIDYLIGSHKLGTMSHEPSYAPGSSQKIKKLQKLRKFKKKTFNLKIGDCLVHHCEVIHGSKANNSKLPRRGFTIQIMDKETSVNKSAFKKYQNSLRKQINRRS